ncbi:MAG TPA: S-methyl-5-thioribose-1-phosphate isomerase [Methanoregulaceae archaeon]|nr:S-methyl-5-thioribose-1-phosphate isomerase [Methanoregulaceae archaeon]
MQMQKTLWYEVEDERIGYINETLLPAEFRIDYCSAIQQLGDAIRTLAIRGAPALGVAGAFGVALSARTSRASSLQELKNEVEIEALRLCETRPTAVNLSWGIQRVRRAISNASTVDELKRIALEEAQNVAAEDALVCRKLGDYGASMLPGCCTVLTHCNAGALACSEWGTALGVVRSAVREGKNVEVIACETRPLLQGARLTAWEMKRDEIPVTVITDSAAAMLMRLGKIDCVIVGADRITKDAVFNKIGTYMHAVCARYHDIPFFVAAPCSTFDPQKSEVEITVEERKRDEIAAFPGPVMVPDGVPVINPAFDATPLSLVTAIITENGVLKPPYDIAGVAGFAGKTFGVR